MNSSTLVSAISLPRPITTRWSAVNDISVIRWLDTSTVRPCAANVAQQVADPADALGIESVHRLVEEQDTGVTEERAGNAQTLSHAE